jgi:formamidopyrimidine-DNA glycosylase
VGNIYANETLFAAGVAPDTPAERLSLRDWQDITVICRQILSDAIEAGGSTVSDFINSSGEQGYFQLQLQVYGKDNSPCQLCGTIIKKAMIGGRATFFCPVCQK